MENRKSFRPLRFLFQVFQGAVIGLGAVLPGVSGGVLAVIFGVYRPIMELLSSPSAHYRTHLPRLLPVFLGYAAGFLGVARLLAFLLETWPDPSVCVFVGLITGMLPSLFREAAEQGRSRGSFVSLLLCMAVIFLILTGVDALSVEVTPNFFWYLFCGFCLALSVIAPGMSFSTLLMPLGLYTPFVDGIGHFDLQIILPGAIGALLTVICLAKAVSRLFDRHYSLAFHGIIGIVIAATVMIIPFSSFTRPDTALVNGICILAGIAAALALDKLNRSIQTD
ncbi:MAG TPA: DUF368 domain-containing protein [Candidatus Bariatricus faecipullorum]|nr:DUF368 domain-containing protein [Candidatus Bariatricus faecipullorum]